MDGVRVSDASDDGRLVVGRIRSLRGLGKQYGKGRWRKFKGIAFVRLADSRVRLAELHWYEAHGIGRRRFKIKRFLDQEE